MGRLAPICVLAVASAVQGQLLVTDAFTPVFHVNCRSGREFDMNGRQIKVKHWYLHGNCTFFGGHLVTIDPDKIAEIDSRQGLLRMNGTTLFKVHLSVRFSALELVDTSSHEVMWDRGGAIQASDSHVYISGGLFRGVAAIDGGAIWVSRGKLDVLHTRFEETEAERRGGAVFGNLAQIRLDHCHFRSTHARAAVGRSPIPQRSGRYPPLVAPLRTGGVIHVCGGHLQMVSTTVHKAFAAHMGGVVCADHPKPLVYIVACNFTDTKAGVDEAGDADDLHDELGEAGVGGLLALFNGTAVIGLSSVIRSVALRKGGVVWAEGMSGVIINGTKIEMPLAMYGGVVYMNGGAARLEGTRIWSAKASAAGLKVMRSRGGVVCAVDARVRIVSVEVEGASCKGDGGVVHQIGGQMHLKTLSVVDTEASRHGGVIYGTHGRLSLFITGSDLTFHRVRAGENGGAIYVRRSFFGTVVIRQVNTMATEAHSGSGGVMFFQEVRTVAVMDSAILGTAAGRSAGGIQFHQIVNGIIINATFLGALSHLDGGAIDINSSQVRATKLVVAQGHARFGGGLTVGGKSTLTLVESLVEHSVARVSGGALAVFGGSVVRGRDLKLLDDTAKEQGGAVYLKEESAFSLQGLETFNTKAGVGGGALFAFTSRVEIVDATFGGGMAPNWVNIGRAPFLLLKNVSLRNLKLVGVFAALWQSTVIWEGLYGFCPPRSHFVNQTSALQCRPCAKDKGMLGRSEIGSSQKCIRCPENSVGVRDVGCQCKAGFVLNNSISGLYAAVNGNLCVSCLQAKLKCNATAVLPIALNCSGDHLHCRNAPAIRGAWRREDSLQAAVECPYWPACRSEGNTKCEEGYEGPLCMVCVAGRFRHGRYSPCRPCTVNTASDVIFVSALVLLLLIAVFVCLNFKKVRSLVGDASEWNERHTSYIRTKAKLVLFSLQTFSTLHQLRFPTVKMVDRASARLSLFSLDVFGAMHISACRLGLGGLGRYCLTLFQLVLIFAVILCFGATTKVSLDWMLLLAYNFTLTNVVKESVGLFLCDRSAQLMTGTTYLLSDYSAACQGFKYHCVCMVAACVLATWCVGIPLFLFARMYQRRHQLNPSIKPDLTCTGGAADIQINAVVTQVNRNYKEALRCFGIATMLHVAKQCGVWRPGTLDCRSASMSWCGESAPSLRDLKEIRKISASSASGVIDSRHLLKRGLRAVEERREPSLLAYRSFYRHYHPDRWYYEFISILGRAGYAVILLLPAGAQCLAGLLLSVCLLLAVCLLMPFHRRSDTQVAALCYLAMIGLFGAHTVRKRSQFLPLFCGVCLALPVLALLYHALQAYVLPGRGEIWTLEAAAASFDEEFVRVRLAPRTRRHQRAVELALLRDAGLASAEGESQA